MEARFDAMLRQYGTVGLIEQVKTSSEHQLEHRTALFLAAMVRIDTMQDHVAAHRDVVADAVIRFPSSLPVARASLCALSRIWGGGLTPFNDTWVPTTKIVSTILKAMAAQANDLLTQQAGVRVLKMHTYSSFSLIKAPDVMDATANAMRNNPHDETIQHWGSELVCAINGMEPSDIVKAHGELGFQRIAVTSVELAVAMPRPPSLLVNGRPWQDVVLSVHPRLRQR